MHSNSTGENMDRLNDMSGSMKSAKLAGNFIIGFIRRDMLMKGKKQLSSMR